MTYFLIAVVVGVALVIGWKLTSRSAYETAPYNVVKSDGKIELREYPELMLVTTTMGTRIQGDGGSFGRLFRYISGGNEGKQKVAMTTPVFMEPQSEQVSKGQISEGQMSFVIPKEVAESKIPAPVSEQVTVTKRSAGTFAVIRFAGRIEGENCDEQLAILKSWVEKQGLPVVGNAEIAGYDPPWTPGPLRRNEILIRVAGE